MKCSCGKCDGVRRGGVSFDTPAGPVEVLFPLEFLRSEDAKRSLLKALGVALEQTPVVVLPSSGDGARRAAEDIFAALGIKPGDPLPKREAN